MALKRGIKELVDAANANIRSWSPEQAHVLHNDPETLFVDIREIQELEREGQIPGAVHAPRGMLEFWVDPESPYHKRVFASGKRLVLYCGIGWRSALATATLQDMGLNDVGHIAGGFKAWRSLGYPVEARKPR